ncbi:hypothetical protein ABPG72_008748 [Tetrahymena utriculariae]
MAEKLQNNQVKELKQYLAFFNQKKEESFKELNLDFKDFVSDNVQDSTIYNKDDVLNLINKWNEQVKKTLSNDISNMSRMSAIYLQYLFQQTGVEFSLNLNLLEDIKMMESMKKVENTDTTFLASSEVKNPLKAVQGKLPSLFESQKTDQNLLKIEQLENELSQLRQENEKLKENVKASSQGKIGTDYEISELSEKFEKLQTEHKFLQEDSQKKLNESAQFNNLKKMIQQKNEQIKEFKDRLSKYEKVE